MTILVGAKVEGVEEYKAALRTLRARLDVETRSATREAAETMKSRIQDMLHLTEHPPHTPTPAPPGTPPSWITGHLSDTTTVRGPYLETTNRWTAEVGPTAEYSRIQELGGYSGRPRVYLPPRPYITPTLLELSISGGIERAYLVRWGRVIN